MHNSSPRITPRPDVLDAARLVSFPEICRRLGWSRSQLQAKIRTGSARLEIFSLPDSQTLYASTDSFTDLARRVQADRLTSRRNGQVIA